MRLQCEILKGIDIRKLLHDGSVVRLDDAFKISDKTASIVKFDGYLVIANIFRVNHMKHNLDQRIDLNHQSFDEFFCIDDRCSVIDFGDGFGEFSIHVVPRRNTTVQHIIVAFLEFRIKAFFWPFGSVFNLVHILEKFRQELPGFNGRNGGCPEIVNISRNDVIEI